MTVYIKNQVKFRRHRLAGAQVVVVTGPAIQSRWGRPVVVVHRIVEYAEEGGC